MRLRSAAHAAALLLLVVVPAALASESGKVVGVVDGDTLKVELGGTVERIRLIGVDTPETVHPQKPVEFFGKEASAFARRLAEGQVVRLEKDPTGDTRDKYGRLLRYVFLPDGTLLNAEIISPGLRPRLYPLSVQPHGGVPGPRARSQGGQPRPVGSRRRAAGDGRAEGRAAGNNGRSGRGRDPHRLRDPHGKKVPSHRLRLSCPVLDLHSPQRGRPALRTMSRLQAGIESSSGTKFRRSRFASATSA